MDLRQNHWKIALIPVMELDTIWQRYQETLAVRIIQFNSYYILILIYKLLFIIACTDYVELSITSSYNPTNSSCNIPCSGAKTEICGGKGFYSVYANTLSGGGVSYNSAILDFYAKWWKPQGCLSDPSGNVLVNFKELGGAIDTTYKCFVYCGINNYLYSGLRNGKECCKLNIYILYISLLISIFKFIYIDCGNALQSNVTVATNQCNTPCAGNLTASCGGINTLSLYSKI